MSLFASTFMYSACKLVGTDNWPAWLAGSLQNLSASDWPAFKTLAHLRAVEAYKLHVDASTYIDRARCVAAARFLESGADVWLTVDDDLEAHAEVLYALVNMCRERRGGIAVPYVNRDGQSMTFRKVSGPTIACGPGLLRRVDRVGFGLVALHRDLVTKIAASVPHFRESDLSALSCPALFVNGVDDGVWMGEDYSFSKLCEDAGHPLHVLLEAPAAHAGVWAMLDSEGRICVQDPARGAALQAGIEEKDRAYHEACGKTEAHEE